MNATLLIIDPQNDFCDIEGAALPVPGAQRDMLRLAQFIGAANQSLAELIVTLDSHPSVAIERTTFWRTGDGDAVASFTQVTEQQVRDGSYLPRDPARLPEVLTYLRALEGAGRYRLMVWPVHCVVGTWGHNVHAAVAPEIARWEERVQRGALKILKGLNPMTEQYSAVSAEVPLADDPSTRPNRALIERASASAGPLLVAGEASSHCVAATMAHLFEELPADVRGRVWLLQDCMSPVSGFEASAEAFFASARSLGARVISSSDALAAL